MVTLTFWNLPLLLAVLGTLALCGRALWATNRPGSNAAPLTICASLLTLLVSMASVVGWFGFAVHGINEAPFSVGPLGFLLLLPAVCETFRFDALLGPKVKHLSLLQHTQMKNATSVLCFLLGATLWDIVRRVLHLTAPGPLILLATLLGVGLLIANAYLLPRLLYYETAQQQQLARRAAWEMAVLRANTLFACYGLVYLASLGSFALLPPYLRDLAASVLFVTFWFAPVYWVHLWDDRKTALLNNATQTTSATAPRPQRTVADDPLRTLTVNPSEQASGVQPVQVGRTSS